MFTLLARDRLYMSESDVYRRQILTYKEGPRAEWIKACNGYFTANACVLFVCGVTAIKHYSAITLGKYSPIPNKCDVFFSFGSPCGSDRTLHDVTRRPPSFSGWENLSCTLVGVSFATFTLRAIPGAPVQIIQIVMWAMIVISRGGEFILEIEQLVRILNYGSDKNNNFRNVFLYIISIYRPSLYNIVNNQSKWHKFHWFEWHIITFLLGEVMTLWLQEYFKYSYISHEFKTQKDWNCVVFVL